MLAAEKSLDHDEMTFALVQLFTSCPFEVGDWKGL
jgi:hypothetical protein